MRIDPNAQSLGFTILISIGLLFATTSDSRGEKPGDFVTVLGEEVPLLMEPETPIIGLEIERILSRHIADFGDYSKSVGTPHSSGIVFDWHIRPVVDPRSARFVDLQIGVYQSHRGALEAAAILLESIAERAKLIPPSMDDPGYVTWSLGAAEGLKFVRDNVFAAFQVAEGLNPQALAQAFDNDLKNGAPGVLRGPKVVPPQIIDLTFPNEFAIQRGGKGLASLGVANPNTGRVYRNIWVQRHSLKPVPPDTEFPRADPPRVEWKESDEVEISHEEGRVTVQLAAVAINELCVVSDVWTKDVRISVTGSAND